MRRLVWAVVAVVILCGSLSGLSQPMGGLGTQSVLLILPADFHDEELVRVLQQFVDREADIYVTGVATTSGSALDALKARIPSPFFNLQTGLSGGPRVTVIPDMMAFEFLYDKTVTFGAGWYDEYFPANGQTGPIVPSYSQAMNWFLGRQLSDHGVVGAIGPGIYPVLFSGTLPQGTTVPAYPCGTLIQTITDQGCVPLPAPVTPRADESGPPLVELQIADDTRRPFLAQQALNGSKVIISPIPSSWYPTTDGTGGQLVSDYADDYVNAIDAIENASKGIGAVTDIQIARVTCGPDGMVTLRNLGENAIDLTGWKLQSVDPDSGEVLYTYTFDHYVLDPGAEVIVYYGMMMWSGPDNYLHWSEDLVLADGARVEFVDAQGNRRCVRDCM